MGGRQQLWPAGASPSQNTGEPGGVTGETGGGGGLAGLSGSESDGANAMCRATDALIRETWPVLRRTRSRSLQAFSSPPDSPPLRSAPASFPTDGRGAEAPLTASAMAAEAEERSSRGRGEDATAGMMAAGFEQEGGGEDGARSKWEEEAVTTRGSSPVGYPSYPSSPSWKGDPDTGERPVRWLSVLGVSVGPATACTCFFCLSVVKSRQSSRRL